MGKLSGENGKLYLGGNVIGTVGEWKLTPTKEITDYTVFGDSKTYEIPLNKTITFEGIFEYPSYLSIPIFKKPYMRIPFGIYKPRELGLKLLGVKYINVGHCPANLNFGVDIIGHVSVFHEGEICIKDGRYVLAEKNTPDEAVLHEYAHILASPVAQHGKEWVSTAERLGIKNPSVKLPYVYMDEEPMRIFETQEHSYD